MVPCDDPDLVMTSLTRGILDHQDAEEEQGDFLRDAKGVGGCLV